MNQKSIYCDILNLTKTAYCALCVAEQYVHFCPVSVDVVILEGTQMAEDYKTSIWWSGI